jgi:hypothetical protein
MALPGFVAEYGLYRSTAHYRSLGSGGGHSQAAWDTSHASQVVPALCQYISGELICTPNGGTECTPLSSQSRSCGNCGTQTQACLSNGTWSGFWTECKSPPGACSPGSTQSCNNGTGTQTCIAGCTWGPCCTGDQIFCGGVCVDPSSNSSNCGRCGNTCPSTSSCRNGVCTCANDRTLCTNCTSTGPVCPPGTFTVISPEAGTQCCVSPDGTQTCGPLIDEVGCYKACVNTSSDSSNCGGCGKLCAPLQTCEKGICTCPPDLPDFCGWGCTNAQTDPLNCGYCGLECKGGMTCQSGICKCADGQTALNTTADCGKCGNACTAPTGGTVSCVNGQCVPACPREALHKLIDLGRMKLVEGLGAEVA